MNFVGICGRLVSDPEVRYTQGEKPMAIATFTLAVERKFKKEGQPTADFIQCSAIGKNGEFAEKYLRKGIKIIIEGHWQTGNYTNKDGVKVYTNTCVADSFEFCESKNASNENASAPNTNPAPASKPATDSDGFMAIPDGIEEEFPFM